MVELLGTCFMREEMWGDERKEGQGVWRMEG